MNYGRDVLLHPSSQYTGGTAMPTINPRGGVFGPQGYGGGIFAGVGGPALGQSDGSAAKKALLVIGVLAGGAYLAYKFGLLDALSAPPTVYSSGGGNKSWWVVLDDGEVVEDSSKLKARESYDWFKDHPDYNPTALYFGTKKQATRYAKTGKP